MPYEILWEDEARSIIRHRYIGAVDVSEYYEVIRINVERLAEVDHPVDVIVDVREMQTDLKGFLTAVRYADRKVPANQRLLIVVGANSFAKVMGNIAQKIAPKAAGNVYFVDDLKQALQRIREYRAGLADEPE